MENKQVQLRVLLAFTEEGVIQPEHKEAILDNVMQALREQADYRALAPESSDYITDVITVSDEETGMVKVYDFAKSEVVTKNRESNSFVNDLSFFQNRVLAYLYAKSVEVGEIIFWEEGREDFDVLCELPTGTLVDRHNNTTYMAITGIRAANGKLEFHLTDDEFTLKPRWAEIDSPYYAFSTEALASIADLLNSTTQNS